MNLLTDEFIEFSKKIADIKKKYEDKKKSFKDMVNKHKAEMAEMEEMAKSMHAEWMKSMEGNKDGE